MSQNRKAGLPRYTRLASAAMPGRVVPLRPSRLATVHEIRPGVLGAAPATVVAFPARPQRRRVHAASGKPRLDPGFPRETRLLIAARDVGCVLRHWPGAPVPCWGSTTAHHRDLTGSGGTSNPGQHVPANGLTLCAAQHDYAHRNRVWARELGLIVDESRDFLAQPVSFDGGQAWYLLAARDGRYLYCEQGGDVA
jgi:hypothetical protein